MSRRHETMDRILRHELNLCRALTMAEIKSLPDCQTRRRGRFEVARWIEKTGQGGFKIVVQVLLPCNLGVSTCDAGGILRDNAGVRDLELREYAEYR